MASHGIRRLLLGGASRRWFNIVYGFCSVFQTCLVLYCEWLPLAWRLVRSRMLYLPTALSGEIPCTVVYIGVLLWISSVLDIPWSIYRTFVLEESHGFNKQTGEGFVSDILTTVDARSVDRSRETLSCCAVDVGRDLPAADRRKLHLDSAALGPLAARLPVAVLPGAESVYDDDLSHRHRPALQQIRAARSGQGSLPSVCAERQGVRNRDRSEIGLRPWHRVWDFR